MAIVDKPRQCTNCGGSMKGLKNHFRICSLCRLNREKTKRKYAKKLPVVPEVKKDSVSWYEKRFGHKRDDSSAGSGYE